jgi:hypothetical protein
MAEDQEPRQACDGGRHAGLVSVLLAEAAARRKRVADDHMFAVDRGRRHPATFRLQLFTAPGARPVAVVIQQAGEGSGLVNEGARYAEAVWRRHCPGHAVPPIWIQRLLLPGHENDGFTAVTFPVTGPYELGPPARRARISRQEITQLIGVPVDDGRGEGFQVRPPEPEQQPWYDVSWVVRLPRPSPFRLPACMPRGTTAWRRLIRQVLPRRRGRDCCWMHQGNWQHVSTAAIRFVRQAQREGTAADDIHRHVLDKAKAAGMSGWELDALSALTDSHDGIQVETDHHGRFYVNGQHKSQAMLDQGVKRTITIRWDYPET